MSWFSKILKQKDFDTELRAAQAVESILSNETLTSDLDDEEAKLLLNWGLEWAKRVALNTSHLKDAAAQENMHPKLKAIRKLMRLVNRWGANLESLEEAQQAKIFAEIVEHTKLIFPQESALRQTPPETLPQLSLENPAQLITQLHQLLNGLVN
ncbi:MAG: hypothetical protein DRI56_13770 [Chloroflexota bacterium]|nr:MAG: hypothetical protein DRI56_13770 [Chloroflexota bacterium]